jgi:hypothetical protein
MEKGLTRTASGDGARNLHVSCDDKSSGSCMMNAQKLASFAKCHVAIAMEKASSVGK